MDVPRSITTKIFKSFNDLIGYYMNYIPNLADLLYLLTELTKKGQPNIIVKKADHERAFNDLNETLIISKLILPESNNIRGYS